MKKFLSIFIALLLIVSLFATTAVAFAEEAQEPSQGETTPTTPDEGETPTTPGDGEGDGEEEEPAREKFDVNETELYNALSQDDWFKALKIEMGDRKFGETMMASSELIHKAFPKIQYVVATDPDYEENKGKNDKIIVEYCRPSESPKGQKTWQNSANITDNIRISSSGWYLFRFVVKANGTDEVLATSKTHYSFFAEDTSRPVVSLSNTMTEKQKNGLTAGTKYSIPTSGLTSGTLSEMSSTTVNFKIFKVKGTTETLIYDSTTKEVTEGYESFVDKDGAITPSNDDISDETVYIVEYSVMDAYGFSGVEDKDDYRNWTADEANPRMLLKVVAAPAEDTNSVNVWEIVLFCIAGAAAIGIVVLLCIKPKDAAPARVANTPAQEDETEATDETKE